MKFTVKQYALSLLEVLENTAPKQQDRVIDNFIKILESNGDIAAYEKIVTEVEKLIGDRAETSQVIVTTAGDANVTPALLKELNQFSKSKMEVTNITDEAIIGGVVIRVDDTLIDASLKTQLDNLEDNLKN